MDLPVTFSTGGGHIFYVYSGQLLFKGELFKSKRASDRELFEVLGKNKRPVEMPSMLSEHQRGFIRYLERVTLTDQNQNTRTQILKTVRQPLRK